MAAPSLRGGDSRALAVNVGVVASLVVTPELGGVGAGAAAGGAVPEGVVEDREDSVGASACVADPPLPVETGG